MLAAKTVAARMAVRVSFKTAVAQGDIEVVTVTPEIGQPVPSLRLVLILHLSQVQVPAWR